MPRLEKVRATVNALRSLSVATPVETNSKVPALSTSPKYAWVWRVAGVGPHPHRRALLFASIVTNVPALALAFSTHRVTYLAGGTTRPGVSLMACGLRYQLALAFHSPPFGPV